MRRTRWPLNWKGGTISVTLDEGCIRAGDVSVAVLELELELKDGKLESVFAAAREMAKTLPLRPAVLSKDDRGYLLIRPGAKARAIPIELRPRPGLTIAAGFQELASRCWRQFAENAARMSAASDVEPVHQMRVALRRLRSLVSFNQALFSERERASFALATREIFKVLGAARDLDIVMETLKERGSSGRGSGGVEALGRERAAAYERVAALTASRRFCAFMLDIVAFIACGTWTKAANGARARTKDLAAVAARIIDRQRRKLSEFRDVSRLGAKKRHRLRIRAKKLRYACEFYGRLVETDRGGAARRAFIQNARDLQDALGRLSDRESARTLIRRRARSTPSMADLVVKENSRLERESLRAAEKAFRRLAKRPPFWA
jgi:inorganic triphosphatase YgiF